MADWIEGTVVENTHWNGDLFSLKIDADVNDFQAGQFTSLALDLEVDDVIEGASDVNADKNRRKVNQRIARPYSYLSAPGVKPLEFFFYKLSDGDLSRTLFTLEAGDKVWIKQQSNGFFTLAEVPVAKDLWMVGTGTGVAPFLSILHTDEAWEKFENIILVHAVRNESDLRYQFEIQNLVQQFPERFTYQPFVSREDVSGAIRSRIPASISDGSLERIVGKDFAVEYSQIMLCGNPGMVKDAMDALKEKGLKKNLRRKPGQITTENYW